MKKCKPFNKHKYRVFQHYFGKFDDTFAICDCPRKEDAELICDALKEYFACRPFTFFIREIESWKIQ